MADALEHVEDVIPIVFSDNGSMSSVDWVYFGLWCLVDTLNVLMSVNICRSVLRRHRVRGERKRLEATVAFENVTVVVPCYLPNEKHIIFDTIDHICSNVDYAAGLTLHVVYNSPKPMPAEEAKLQALHGAWHGAQGRRVFVHKVEGSTSKAENLNHVIGSVLLPEAERFVAIFDADHFPDRDCITTLMGFLLLNDIDCVQGSTYIRNRKFADHLPPPRRPKGAKGCALPGPLSWVQRRAHQVVGFLLANFIDAEFFMTYFIWMPAIELIGQTGLFGGSVALWKYSKLADYAFSTSVQTEDIDASARAVLERAKIRFCPEARSGELSPASLRSFWRQRQRWAIGWDQVSIRYFSQIAESRLSIRKKLGLYYVFPGRWAACTIGLIAGVVHPTIAVIYNGQPWGPWLNGALMTGAFFYAISTATILSQMLWYRGPGTWPFVVVFYLAGPLYLLLQAALVLQSLVRISCGTDSGWVVTQRAVKGHHAADGAAGATAEGVGARLATPPPRSAPQSPFAKHTPGEEAPEIHSEYALALTHFLAPNRIDSVNQRLDQMDGDAAGDGAAAEAARSNGAAQSNGDGGAVRAGGYVAAARASGAGGAGGYQRML